MKIGIVIGSIREGRKGRSVGEWVHAVADENGGAEFELIDLKEFEVPLLTASVNPAAANRQYDSPNVRRWSAAIDACDGFVFVTAEYNHGVPGAFKNAVDSLGPEWMGKPVAFVSYGSVGGVRSVEQWRQIIANFSMIGVRAQVTLSNFTEFDGAQVTPGDRKPDDLRTALDQLLALGTAD
ncbi:NADPH-dependent FMN reductase [Microbacterium fluvii]|uniref:NADPH-dependent FMN reductase n=1 Tax=Microbacterium fluvii TaxID=415215 RepID=A0ABW2HE64_9MICO|nr:NAD(P)H-dependent oxidoreductase [Microbacterium fluvii]MCU4673255.1 NAD(P)H-dependent oxidoreductase [Microbacterium fluvii]